MALAPPCTRVVQTVQPCTNWLMRLAYGCLQGFPTSETAPKILCRYVLDLDIIYRMIFLAASVRRGLVSSMDRTNWKFGEFNINILMLGMITYSRAQSCTHPFDILPSSP